MLDGRFVRLPCRKVVGFLIGHGLSAITKRWPTTILLPPQWKWSEMGLLLLFRSVANAKLLQMRKCCGHRLPVNKRP